MYLSSDVMKILGLTQRQVINWAEKGLVVPLIEAQGAGTKRGYTYTNLLEFGLCNTLFDMGLENHKVKKILKDLREGGQLKAWAENYKGFFHSMAEGIMACFGICKDIGLQEESKRDAEQFGFDLNDPARCVEYIKERITPEKPVGFLLYFFKDDESTFDLYPLPIEELIGGQLVNFLMKYKFRGSDMHLSKGIIMVNLGKIKDEIDNTINEIGY